MDYSLERERTRINRIISKFSCNYTSPISLAKQSLNKMTRHRKLYSYESDSLKDQDSDMRSVKMLLDQSYNRLSKDRINNNLNQEYNHHSSQHIFTFQTLREAMVANPDLAYLKYLDNVTDKNSVEKKKKPRKKNVSNDDKALKYLPSLKKIQNPKQKQENLSVASHRVMAQAYRSPEDKSKFSKISDGEMLDLSVHGDTENLKEIRTFERKIKGFIPGVIKRGKKDEGFAYGMSKNNKILHVVLPKYHKNSYFNDHKVLRNFSDEETSVKGWDKSTPLDMLDAQVLN